jgi:hypothetical protein
VLSSLPATDVEVGSVLGFNDPTNGLRDIVDYVERLRPTVFYPIHHDFVAEYGASQRMEGIMEREMAKRGELPTELRWLSDPQDYLRPSLMTFDPEAERWGGPVAEPEPTLRRCMREKLRVRPRGIGFVRIGAEPDVLATRSAMTRRGARRLRFCVGSAQDELVTAVGDERGPVRLITTIAPLHRTRGIGAGSTLSAMKRRYRRTVALGGGLHRASPGSRIVFAARGGRVRLVAVADRELLARPARLKRYLRRG